MPLATRTLRSGGGLLLDVPRVNLQRYGCRAFVCAGPTLWNSASGTMRDPEHQAVWKIIEDISVLFNLIRSHLTLVLFMQTILLMYSFIYLRFYLSF